MAQQLSADQFLAVLKKAGVRVVEHGDWRTRNRNHKGPWGPVNGVMIHHTGPYATEAAMVELCRTGYTSLPGPLCHGVIDRTGTVHLVGYGRANHAGSGDGDVLEAVIAEKALPPDNEADTDGNPHFYGFECINTGGGQAWPQAQLDAMYKVSAALCQAHGWGARSVIGHKEWQPGKTDPAGISMDDFRTAVAKAINGGQPPNGTPPEDTPEYAPFPGADYFRPGRRSPLITAMGERLVAGGCGKYSEGPGPAWTDADRRSYAAWQRKLGYTGDDADGIPGPTSWAKLRVPTP
ncbi:peptidoglycan-binding protein [Streptomyces sp. Li-HN-5-11]|uniref:peptidoglycan-binding protein n=1 Tax=Streptomyces sp. Li-HN-5-11 TaxID=3075432 RepID=UPI0028AE280B|nr:peptidoglycan-binding protein [Streptomyces sp. Li-HN-5-11]WNM34966.1 peptidoglycan-binding protein [Streptomyces sp. Li-HN-5-11]